MNDIVVHTITRRRINKIINNKSVGNKRINLPNGRLSAEHYKQFEINYELVYLLVFYNQVFLLGITWIW